MDEFDWSQRLTDLEIKFSFIEEHVSQQDREILKLRTLAEKQNAELERLRVEQTGDGMTVRPDERPPHY